MPRRTLPLRLTALSTLLVAAAACGGDDGFALPLPATPTATLTAASPLPTPTAQMQGNVEYTVVSGDTLSAIAEQFGVTVEAIVAANNLADPDELAIDQKLIIPRQ